MYTVRHLFKPEYRCRQPTCTTVVRSGPQRLPRRLTGPSILKPTKPSCPTTRTITPGSTEGSTVSSLTPDFILVKDLTRPSSSLPVPRFRGRRDPDLGHEQRQVGRSGGWAVLPPKSRPRRRSSCDVRVRGVVHSRFQRANGTGTVG